MTELWDIVDRRTGRPATVVSFGSQESAQRQIDWWQERRRRGGRPDVTQEMLDNYEPRRRHG